MRRFWSRTVQLTVEIGKRKHVSGDEVTMEYIYIYIYIPGQKYKTSLKDVEKDIVYNF